MNKRSIRLGLMIVLIALMGLVTASNVFAVEYIVQPGDNLTHIARRFGTTVEAIVQANNIADPDIIVIGQVLDIPVENAGEMMPTVTERLLVADFDDCVGTNNLGGAMGAAFQTPGNTLTESYVSQAAGGCVARLEYEVKDWGAFWMKLQNVDLTSFRENDGVLSFDIRGDEPIPAGVKIELKRFCVPDQACGEFSVYYMTWITSEWETRRIPLEGFGSVGWAAPLSSWEGIEELVFTFEAHNSGNNGIVYLDNIAFERYE